MVRFRKGKSAEENRTKQKKGSEPKRGRMQIKIHQKFSTLRSRGSCDTMGPGGSSRKSTGRGRKKRETAKRLGKRKRKCSSKRTGGGTLRRREKDGPGAGGRSRSQRGKKEKGKTLTATNA